MDYLVKLQIHTLESVRSMIVYAKQEMIDRGTIISAIDAFDMINKMIQKLEDKIKKENA